MKTGTVSGQNDRLVSVIIPVYNVRFYLEEALDSVLHQTYGNLEIILVDDGSDDSSGEICDRYAERDSRIRVIRQEHQGPGAARNAALDVMQGEYAAFLDSDDAFLPEMIETLLTALERERADAAACRFGQIVTDQRLDRTEVRRKEPALAPGIYDRTALLYALAEGRLNVGIWNKLYRAELWKDVRFPTGLKYEDLPVAWPVFFRAGRTVMLQDVLYLYRRRPGSTTWTKSLQTFRDMLACMPAFDRFVEENTPGIFTEEQLLTLYRGRLTTLLWEYARQPVSEMPQEELKQLRQRILDLGRATRGRGCGLRIWCGWQLFRISPRLLKSLYGIYYALYAKHMENKH